MILFTKYETNYRILSLLTHKNSKKKFPPKFEAITYKTLQQK